MLTENTYSLISYFAAQEDGRYRQTLPFILKDYAYATDGHWMARTPKGLIPADAQLATPEKIPPCDEVWKQFKPSGKFIPITELEEPACEKCGGLGYWTCRECETEHECKECGNPQAATYASDEFNIFVTLDMNRVNKLVRLGFKQIEISLDDPKHKKPVRAMNGDVEVLMSVMLAT